MTFKLIVVGTSWGGLQALEVLLSALPNNFRVPIAVVQHRHPNTEDNLALVLQDYSNLIVKTAADKEAIAPGYVYLAPADYHLLVEARECPYFALSNDVPVSYARPSIDVLFETAADAYGDKLWGVILTGANYDGVQGLTKIKARGGHTVAQSPATALCPMMPQAAIKAGVIDKVLPLDKIGPFLVQVCQ